MKFAAGIEYNGAQFFGWQSQSHARNVQDCLERALTIIAGDPDDSIKTVCAGRTDSGVHATGQVVHFETTIKREPHEWLRGANSFLDDDVSVRWVSEVEQDFHARNSAIRRHYRYIILNIPHVSALFRQLTAHWHEPLDATAMHLSAQALIGEHDFSSFRSAGCQSNSPYKHVYHVNVARHKRLVYIDVCANAFLQHMVRNIVGALIEVGNGTKTQDWPALLLKRRDRTQGGIAMPGNGLYLVHIEYDTHYQLPNEVIWPSFG